MPMGVGTDICEKYSAQVQNEWLSVESSVESSVITASSASSINVVKPKMNGEINSKRDHYSQTESNYMQHSSLDTTLKRWMGFMCSRTISTYLDMSVTFHSPWKWNRLPCPLNAWFIMDSVDYAVHFRLLCVRSFNSTHLILLRCWWKNPKHFNSPVSISFLELLLHFNFWCE